MELLNAFAGAQAATGRFAAARTALLESLELLPDEASMARVRLTAACAGVEQLLGMHEEAHARLEAALRTIDEQGSPQAAALMVSLASGAFFRQAYTEARDWGARALAVARDLNDAPLIAAAAAAVALVSPLVGETAEAEAHRAEAAALIDAMSDDQLALRLDAIAYLAVAELYLNQFAESTNHARRGLTVARASAQGELYRCSSRPSPGASACKATSSKLRTCWMERSKGRASRAMTRCWRGISSTARSWQSNSAT